MKDNLHEKFLQAGYKTEVRALESFQDDYGLQGPGVDEPDRMCFIGWLVNEGENLAQLERRAIRPASNGVTFCGTVTE